MDVAPYRATPDAYLIPDAATAPAAGWTWERWTLVAVGVVGVAGWFGWRRSPRRIGSSGVVPWPHALERAAEKDMKPLPRQT